MRFDDPYGEPDWGSVELATRILNGEISAPRKVLQQVRKYLGIEEAMGTPVSEQVEEYSHRNVRDKAVRLSGNIRVIPRTQPEAAKDI